MKTAEGQRLGALCLTGMERLGWPVPKPALRKASQQARARAVLHQHTLKTVSDALTNGGIRHVFFKGALTDLLWWGGCGLRGSSDVDVLVTPADFRAAQRCLGVHGYVREDPLTHPVTSRWSKEATLRKGDAAVDLHRALFNRPFSNDTRGVLSRAVAHQTSVGVVMGPSLEDTLVLCAGNLAGDRFLPRVKLGLDAWQALVHGASLEHALVRARAAGVDWSLWALLQILERHGLVTQQASSAPPIGVAWWLGKVAAVEGEAPRPSHQISRLLLESWPLSQSWTHPVAATARWAAQRVLDHAWLKLHLVGSR